MARYPRRDSPPLGAKGQDTRSQLTTPKPGAIGILESSHLTMLSTGLIVADWSARSPAVGAVASWLDDIGGLNLVQADSTKQPVKSLTGFDAARDGVVSDGVNDFLRVASVTGLPTGATPGCLFLVASRTAVTDPSLTNTTAISYGGTGAGTVRMIGKTVNVARTGDGTTQAFDHSKSNWEGPAVIAGIFEATQYTLRFNGEEIEVQTGATLNTSTTSITFFADNGAVPAEFHSGAIARAIITPALTLEQITQMEGWLAYEYEIAALLHEDHPFAYAQLN